MAGEVKECMKKVMKRIPFGKVTNYGSIADVVSGELMRRITPRIIGWQLSGMTEEECRDVPWQRVVNKKGLITSIKLGDKGWRQKDLLEKEGVVVDGLQIDMGMYAIEKEELAY